MAKNRKLNKAVCNRFRKQRERENMQKKRKQTRITDFFKDNFDTNLVELESGQNVDYIDFLQINNQKRIMSSQEIMRLAETSSSFCIMGQERSTYGFNVTGLNSRHTIIQAAVEKPRAYICCHKYLNVWPVESL